MPREGATQQCPSASSARRAFTAPGSEPGKLPAAADEALERLLSREDRISDLIAFLAALDPEPFLAALGLALRQGQGRGGVRRGGPGRDPGPGVSGAEG